MCAAVITIGLLTGAGPAVTAAAAQESRTAITQVGAVETVLEGPVAADCDAIHAVELSQTVALTAELVTSGSAAGQSNLPEFCRVALKVSEAINIELWLPTDSYNGRFQAVGGGGYAGALSYGAMANALRAGYATASTDTGHTGGSGAFALNADGSLNHQLIEDFASRSIVEMTLKAQTLIDEFYGADAEYSYWNGCSTGGRQGLMLARLLPDAYDGMQIAAPAINWDRLVAASLWPYVVMQNELGQMMDACKLTAFTEATIAHCDGYDGVIDGILGDPRLCDFDPADLIGRDFGCGVITETDAEVVAAMYRGAVGRDGEQLWFGVAPGTPLGPFSTGPTFLVEEYHRLWIEQDPTWDWRTLDYLGFEANFRESQSKFNSVIGTDDPDLRAFEDAGGKMVLWQGWGDTLGPEATIDYYERVIDEFPSHSQVNKFARLFMAPGVYHCGGGPGPSMFDPFAALIDWVENDHAPETILASRVEGGEVQRTQPLCPYPKVAAYDGRGDVDDAASYRCRPNYGSAFAARAG